MGDYALSKVTHWVNALTHPTFAHASQPLLLEASWDVTTTYFWSHILFIYLPLGQWEFWEARRCTGLAVSYYSVSISRFFSATNIFLLTVLHLPDGKQHFSYKFPWGKVSRANQLIQQVVSSKRGRSCTPCVLLFPTLIPTLVAALAVLNSCSSFVCLILSWFNLNHFFFFMLNFCYFSASDWLALRLNEC